MDLTTSETLKATCKLLGTVNAIALGIWLLCAAIIMADHVVAGIQFGILSIIFFLIVLFLIKCGACLAEIHTHFCRVEGLDRERR
jgi:hypothetical protein